VTASRRHHGKPARNPFEGPARVRTSVDPLPRLSALLVAGLCSALLPGCSGDGADDCSGASLIQVGGSLAFRGECAGTHSSTVACDGSATMIVGVNLSGGKVKLTVQDADGETLYAQTHGAGRLSDEKELAGAAGNWTLTAERQGDASGQYALYVDCEE
jgi:hypothetical protein